MKNQYFGDNRDLFKYDLILRVIEETDSINHFTFIPMLTKNDDTKQGGERNRDKAKAGTKNKDLRNFLDEYFSHENRREYFKQIGNEFLSKSLVFVDPDIGLQVRKSREKHILYREVKDLYERMDESSILMIYQHFPRIRTQNNIQKHFCERSEELKKIAGDLPIYIDDNEIRFFFLVKDKSLRESLSQEISKYGKVGNA
ncbi:MAG: hypothetical protein LRZ87_00120 [Methanocellales archaeon]|nr:hypothetical protein [Methanocellales archaeon]